VTTDPSRVRAIIVQVREAANKQVADELTDEMSLYAGGLELDSLEAAELSAQLEDEFGSDPFSAALAAGGELPDTVGDVLAFYPVASSA
jgi:acyl carrier protein